MKIFLTISITSIIFVGLVYIVNCATYNGDKKINLKRYSLTKCQKQKSQ
jgi:hypothetical protein